MSAPIDPIRLRQLGVRKARVDHDRLVQRDDGVATFWHPDFADAYDSERERLGDCAPGGHEWLADRVKKTSPESLRRVRIDGRAIDVCTLCGVWLDRR